MLSPSECGYGIRHAASIRVSNRVVVITILHTTRLRGMSPIKCLALSECVSELFSVSFSFFISNTQFQLVFNKIVIYPVLLYQ